MSVVCCFALLVVWWFVVRLCFSISFVWIWLLLVCLVFLDLCVWSFRPRHQFELWTWIAISETVPAKVLGNRTMFPIDASIQHPPTDQNPTGWKELSGIEQHLRVFDQ